MSVVFLQRVADQNGVLANAYRAIKFGPGISLVEHPLDSLTGALGGDGQVTGYVEVRVDTLAATDVNPTPNTVPIRDGDAGLKAAYLDSGAASDLTLKRNGAVKVTVGASGVTIADLNSAGVVHTNSSGLLSTSLVVNADVSATAAIAGTKVSPDFGSQTVTTTGILAGATVKVGASGFASLGMIRLQNASAAGVLGGDGNGVPMMMRNFAGSADLRVFQCNASDDFVFGSQDPRNVYIRASAEIYLLGTGGQWSFSASGVLGTPGGITLGGAPLTFVDGVSPVVKQADKGSAGVGAVFSNYAQKGNGPNAGGIYKVGGGASGDGSTVAGATQVDLGALTGASLSAKLTVSAVAGLGVSLYQADSSKFLIEASAAQFTILNTGGTTGIVQVAANGHSALEVGWSNTHSAATVRVGGDGYLTFFGGGSTPVSQRTITNNSGGSLQATLAALPSGTVWASDAQTVKDWVATILLGLQELNMFHN